jgi:hypothetical protein
VGVTAKLYLSIGLKKVRLRLEWSEEIH